MPPALAAWATQLGLYIGSNDNTIGGTTAAARNVISGSNFLGISLVAGADYNLVEGNYIGPDATGNATLGSTEASAFKRAGAAITPSAVPRRAPATSSVAIPMSMWSSAA